MPKKALFTGMLAMMYGEILGESLHQGVMPSVVVSTYMKRESIPKLIGRTKSSLEPLKFEIIIVEDASQTAY